MSRTAALRQQATGNRPAAGPRMRSVQSAHLLACRVCMMHANPCSCTAPSAFCVGGSPAPCAEQRNTEQRKRSVPKCPITGWPAAPAQPPSCMPARPANMPQLTFPPRGCPPAWAPACSSPADGGAAARSRALRAQMAIDLQRHPRVGRVRPPQPVSLQHRAYSTNLAWSHTLLRWRCTCNRLNPCPPPPLDTQRLRCRATKQRERSPGTMSSCHSNRSHSIPAGSCQLLYCWARSAVMLRYMGTKSITVILKITGESVTGCSTPQFPAPGTNAAQQASQLL